MSTPLVLVPITLREAHAFVARVHRHHKPSRGGRFAIGAARADSIIGVAAEVTRVAVMEGEPNACFRRLITYTMGSESGTSLRAAGWKEIGARGGGSWSCTSRPCVDTHPLEQKRLWEAVA